MDLVGWLTANDLIEWPRYHVIQLLSSLWSRTEGDQAELVADLRHFMRPREWVALKEAWRKSEKARQKREAAYELFGGRNDS